MKNPIFKAKILSTNGWVFGNYIRSARFRGCSSEFRIHEPLMSIEFDIDPDTICIGTGIRTNMGWNVFQNDVFFEEIEYDEGDHRIYYIVTWVYEWARFVLLENFAYIDYMNVGIDALDEDERYDFTKKELSKMHYAGNIIDNKELLYV